MDVEKLCMGCMKELEQPGVCPHCGYQADAAKAEGHYLRPYSILNGKYLVGRVLGEGGFGITYIGYDLNLEMPVAIKEFYPNGYVTRENSVTGMVSAYQGTNLDAVSKWKNNFIKEARTLAKCSHLSGIVGVKDFFEENGTAYIAMEYLEGMTLKNYVKSCGGKVEMTALLKVLEPVMTSLAKVHEYGLIHRDISPDNIMLLSGGTMKLLDFGAARDYASEDEKSLSVMLKPGYAPEEQYRTKGKQGPWSDVYAFAATMYKCITGITPPESMERLRQDELKTPTELGISINPQIENALLKGMEVYAEKRYQSMTEFKNAIYEGLQYMPMPTQQTTLEQPVLPATNQTAELITQSVGELTTNPSKAVLSKGVAVAHSAFKKTKAAAVKLWGICQKYWIAMAVAAGVIIALIIVWAINVVTENMVNVDVKQTVEVEERVPEKAEEVEKAEKADAVQEENSAEKAQEAIASGNEYYVAGDYVTAFAYYEEAEELNPDNEEVYLLESNCYLMADDPVNAAAVLDEGILKTGKIALDTRRNYILENTVLITQEKYQNGVMTQQENYDSNGNLVAQYLYDERGNLDEWGEYVYTNGILTSQVHYYENGAKKEGTAYYDDGRENVYASYDRSGRMTEVYIAEYDNSGKLSRKVYYETNKLTINSSMQSVLANGIKWWKIYEYDQYGNQTRDISYNTDGSLSSWQEYNYNTDGNMAGYTAFRADGEINVYAQCSYDIKGNQIGITEHDAYGNINWRKTCEYDALGNCIRELFYYGGSEEAGTENDYVNIYQFNG